MKYFKVKKTGDVYAYEQSDINTVNSIDALENDLSKAEKKLADTPEPPKFVPEYDENGKQTNSDANAAEREAYQAAQAEVVAVQAALDEVLPVFFDIREKLKDMREMTPEEVEAHINPVPTTEQLAEQVRAERDSLLRELDSFVSNPIRWGGLTDKQKTEAAEYRQDLLDVPQQDSFPEEVVWPTKPSFLE